MTPQQSALDPETRQWMLDRLAEGGNRNDGRNVFLGLIDAASLSLADVVAGRSALADAALRGCADSADALGRAWAGAVGTDAETSLWWFMRAASLGSRDAVYSGALVAAHIAWFERRDDPGITERALGLLCVALCEWPEPPQADVLLNLRADMVTLWPELEWCEAEAGAGQRRAMFGRWH